MLESDRAARRGRVARLVSLAGAALAVGAAAGAPAAVAAKEAPEPFVADGTIKAPLRFAAEPTYQSWAGGQRQVYTNTEDNGTVGYTVELPPRVAGGTFDLEVQGGLTRREDIDVTFYESFTPTVSGGTYQTRQVGGEEGDIPARTRFAIVTMFNGADVKFELEAREPEEAAKEPGGPALPALPAPGIHADYGKVGTAFDPFAAKLRRDSQVVIAVVDTGINPYHVAYRRPQNVVHPSRYIEGFPADVPALGLTQEGDYTARRKADDGPVWGQVGEKKLYWVPGTNIIGAYSVQNYRGTPPGGLPSRPIIDDDGHGTGTTSVAAGAGRSSLHAPFGSNPDALIVSLEGLGDAGVKWASEQPWIDFISGSYGDPLAVPCNDDEIDDDVDDEGVWCGKEYKYTAPFVLRDGRTACFSAGNGLSRTGVAGDRYSSLRPTSGPSWVVTVGASSPRNKQNYSWHSVPADVTSYGLYWPAAAEFSIDGEQSFGGTSNATPVTCGVFSKALLEARRALGDSLEGVHETKGGLRVPAQGRRFAKGPLDDGVLTRTELQDAVFKTAEAEEFDAERSTYDAGSFPKTPAYYMTQGYGLANVESGTRAVDVLLGRAALPDRREVDEWIATVDKARDTVYEPPKY